MADDRRSYVAALGKALQVLEAFGPRTPDLRLAEIAELTGLNRSSAQRTVYTLARCGYLKRDPASTAISLSHRCALLAHRYITANHLIDMSMQPLAELSAATGMQCDLWVLSGEDIVNIARIMQYDLLALGGIDAENITRLPSATMAAVLAPTGERHRADSHAAGRILCGQPLAHDAGCSIDLAPIPVVAAPVFGADGQCVAAVSITTRPQTLDSDEQRRLCHAVAATAQTISQLRIQPWARTFADTPPTSELPDIPEDDDPLFITSVARGLRTLEAFAFAQPELTLTDLHHVTGYPIPTLQRLLETLIQHGYVEKEPRHKTFRLAVRTLDLLFNLQMSDRVLKTVWPRLVRLRDECGLRCSFCILDGKEILHLLTVQSQPGADFRAAYMGKQLPAISTSGGRAILSQLSGAELDSILAEPVRAITPYTETNPDKLRSEIALSRTRGFAFTDQQSILHEVNVAAAVVEANGTPLGAIVISAPCRQWDLARLEREIVPLLLPYTKALFS
ncbi:IclR family transcriptional regulator [Vogesella sp. LIG4]|uniref:IclR family transcriptional regulator n=1 Tax=Vogesella sp. LIG4 TaxID=1192162 RepID=UPI00081FF167|nr:helix-turn-helix domain-containing protein [Vogesella sp. LIG4]SCK24350.1 transcriptional regulator, IclR family [Vogesella sp. LIG4]